MDHKTNVRMMTGVFYQIFCHHIHRGWRHAEMDRRCLANFDHFSFRNISHGKKTFRPHIQCFSRLCQPDMFAPPYKQAYLQFFFQHFHLITKRRLCHMQGSGRTTDGSLIYDCTKIFQLFDLHSFLRFPFSYLYRNYFLFI